VAKTFLDDLGMNSTRQELGSVAVSKIVETNPREVLDPTNEISEFMSEAFRLLGLSIFPTASKR